MQINRISAVSGNFNKTNNNQVIPQTVSRQTNPLSKDKVSFGSWHQRNIANFGDDLRELIKEAEKNENWAKVRELKEKLERAERWFEDSE